MSASFMPTVPAGVRPGSMLRRNFPTVTADHVIAGPDKGAVAAAAGITLTLPAYVSRQQGQQYDVRNLSSGDITVVTVDGEFIMTVGPQDVTSIQVPSGHGRVFERETSTSRWILL